MLDETASTNDEARARTEGLPRAIAHGTVVIARRQTAGRGTRGRRWWSPPGAGLSLSVVIAPDPTLERPAALTLIAAVAVAEAAESFGARVAIKWPNDVVDADGGKLCGILGENVSSPPPRHVIGIGVNVLPLPTPPPDLEGRLSDLIGAGAGDLSRGAFALRLLTCLERQLLIHQRDGIARAVAAFQERSWLSGREVRLRRGAEVRQVRFLELTERLTLLLEDPAGSPFEWPAEQVERVRGPAAEPT